MRRSESALNVKAPAVGGAVNAFLHSGCEYGALFCVLLFNLINYISRFVFFTRTFLTSAKIIICGGFCRIFTDEQKQCFAAFVFLSLSLSLSLPSVCECVFIVLFPARARMIPHQNRRRERERHFFRRSS